MNDASTIVLRLTSALCWLRTINASTTFPDLVHNVLAKVRICEALARASTLMKAIGNVATAEAFPSKYGHGVDIFDYVLLDWEHAAIQRPVQTVTSDPMDILSSSERFNPIREFMLKDRDTCPTSKTYLQQSINLDVNTGRYARLVKRMLDRTMVKLLRLSEETVQNSVFKLWKVTKKSQYLRWGREDEDLNFHPEASAVELPATNVNPSFRFPAGENLYFAGWHISQLFIRLSVPEFLVPFLGMSSIRSSLVNPDYSFKLVVPCLTCSPIGATFAPSLAQRVTILILAPGNILSVPMSRFDDNRHIRHRDDIQLLILTTLTAFTLRLISITTLCVESFSSKRMLLCPRKRRRPLWHIIRYRSKQ